MKSPPLSEWIERARAACVGAMKSDELSRARDFLAGQGLQAERSMELLRATAEAQSVAPALMKAREAAIGAYGSAENPVAVERVLLVQAALQNMDRVPELAIDESTAKLFCKEFISYADPPEGAEERLAMTAFSFISMSRIVFLLRYPGGMLHWERSGLPRSWLARIPVRFLFRTLRFVALEIGAFKPYLVQHMGGTVLRYPFVRESEARLSFYRMAAAAEKQPEIKGLMAGSWLVSRETHRVSPHLACLSRPFLEAGGIYFELGPAHIDDGFLVGDERRNKLYAAGEYKPTFGVVLCTRRQAIDWKAANASLEPLLDVR